MLFRVQWTTNIFWNTETTISGSVIFVEVPVVHWKCDKQGPPPFAAVIPKYSIFLCTPMWSVYTHVDNPAAFLFLENTANDYDLPEKIRTCKIPLADIGTFYYTLHQRIMLLSRSCEIWKTMTFTCQKWDSLSFHSEDENACECSNLNVASKMCHMWPQEHESKP